MTQHEREMLHKHEKVLFGTEPDQRDGLAAIVTDLTDTLHGTDRDPEGVVFQVKKLTKTFYIGSGILIVVQAIGGAVLSYLMSKLLH